ncbi:MAG: uroporphyrinogen-III synthase, partial [Myxococcota bacterium]
ATPRQTQMKTTIAALPGAFRSPALVVANPSSSGLDWFERQPLFGRRVVVTRPPHQAEPTVRELARRGAQPIRFATIAITDPPEPERIKTALAQLSEYDLVVFTSANGVDFFFARLRERGLDSRALGGLELAAIGPATAARLNHHGLYADIQAETFVAEYLVEAIVARWQGRSAGRVLLPRALVARELLPEELRRHGFTVDVLPVYETVDAASAERDALRSLLARGVDAILLTSSSTVERLARALGDDASARLADVTLASIGPITTKTAEDLGLTVAVTASVSTGPGLIDALETYFRVHGNESPQRKVI